jgi:hypothetical protein
VKRRRLKVAEKRMIEPVVDEAVAAATGLVDQIEAVLVETTRSLPEDLRYEAIREAMNGIGGQLFYGVELALLIEADKEQEK